MATKRTNEDKPMTNLGQDEDKKKDFRREAPTVMKFTDLIPI